MVRFNWNTEMEFQTKISPGRVVFKKLKMWLKTNRMEHIDYGIKMDYRVRIKIMFEESFSKKEMKMIKMGLRNGDI